MIILIYIIKIELISPYIPIKPYNDFYSLQLQPHCLLCWIYHINSNIRDTKHILTNKSFRDIIQNLPFTIVFMMGNNSCKSVVGMSQYNLQWHSRHSRTNQISSKGVWVSFLFLFWLSKVWLDYNSLHSYLFQVCSTYQMWCLCHTLVVFAE